MVGRYESAELRQEFAAQEARWSRSGSSWYWGVLVLILLLFAAEHVHRRRHDFTRNVPTHFGYTDVSSSQRLSATSDFDGGLYGNTFGREGDGVTFGYGRNDGAGIGPTPLSRADEALSSRQVPLPDEDFHTMRLDFSLIGLLVAVVVVCACPLSGASSWTTDPYDGETHGAGQWDAGCSPSAPKPPWSIMPSGLYGQPPLPADAGQNAWAGGGVFSPHPWNNPYMSPAPAITGLNRTGAFQGNLLPTEGEVRETYWTFGRQLQRWMPAVSQYLCRDIIKPLLEHLDNSDRHWRAVAADYGLPPLVKPVVEELRVFEDNLPQRMAADPQITGLWQQRQRMEAFLRPRGFESPEHRQYVKERLRQWHQHGMRHGTEQGLNVCQGFMGHGGHGMPSDGHILENLVASLLNQNFDFEKHFVSVGQMPPPLGVGQSQAAFLRQVTDQSCFPRPPPHYDVVTQHGRVWRLRPSGTNQLEALGLLLIHLLRHRSQLYGLFPEALRRTVEATEVAGFVGRPLAWLHGLWRSLGGAASWAMGPRRANW